MQKSKNNKPVKQITRIGAALALALLVAFSTYPGRQTATAASSTCTSITDCTNQINSTQNAVSDLKNQAVSYKDAITRLSSSIGQTRSDIAYSQSQRADLEQQITAAQAQIDHEKAVLSENLRTMYVEGRMSPIEALATSSKLSDYVDKEEYRNSVQNSIQGTLASIADQQAKLTQQKQQVVALLSEQQAQAASLQSQQSQQSSMLNYNQSQQSSYNALTAANQSKLNALIAAQRSANNASTGGYYFLRFPGAIRGVNPGSYPYAHSGFSMSTAPGCNDGDGPDKWHYCTRQCVSYAAYAVEASGRRAPVGWGNAKNWVARARSSGVLVSNVPQRGDVAISTHGTWGHAMYVEQVSGKQIYVSQYNQQLTGQFSYQWRAWQ